MKYTAENKCSITSRIILGTIKTSSLRFYLFMISVRRWSKQLENKKYILINCEQMVS